MPKKRNSKYWQQRFDQVEQAANNKSVKYVKQLEKKYTTAAQQLDTQINAWYQRIARNNNVSVADAKKLLSKSELDEFKWTVEQYIEYGQKNAISQDWMKELENASAKFHINRLEALKLEARQQIEQVFANGQQNMFDTLADVYKESFYRSCFEIQKGFGVGFDVSALDDGQVSRLLNKPWSVDGTNFSTKLWGNKKKLINTLDQELSRMVLTGESPKNAIQNIRKSMNTSLYNAKRLVLTEQAYFTSLAQQGAYGELDVEEYEIVATLDGRTSEVCRDMDGKHFPVKDMQPGLNAPPFHVFCRTTTCPYFDDEFTLGKRVALGEDGQMYEVPEKMTYREWERSFVDGGDKSGLIPYNLQFFAYGDYDGIVTNSIKDYSSASFGSKDVTRRWLSRTGGGNTPVEDVQEFMQDGVEYAVDGKHVVLDYKENELHIANVLNDKYGRNVLMMPRVNEPPKIQTPDFLIDGARFDLKSPTGSGKEVLFGMVKGKYGQADNFVFDISNCPLTEDDLVEQARKIFTSRHTRFVDSVVLMKDDEIVLVLQRE